MIDTKLKTNIEKVITDINYEINDLCEAVRDCFKTKHFVEAQEYIITAKTLEKTKNKLLNAILLNELDKHKDQ